MMGKTIAKPSPNLSAPEEVAASEASEMKPTRPGPPAQPTSPAKASKANKAVPPVGQVREERLSTPGHMMPTEKPHKAQPAKDSNGYGAKTAIK